MCGLLTFLSANGQADARKDAISEALESLHHRGPDETAVTMEANDVVFGFKRLSIIDIEHSHQPLPYLDGRYLLTFNGEIYNYRELRQQLKDECAAEFATDGDSEVIPALFHYWGPEAVSRLRGMFAFVIWDRQERRAFGARDPFGIKPLHYTLTEDGAYFASEKKALLPFAVSSTEGNKGIDQRQLSHYFTVQYVPEPSTLHTGIHRIEGGESFTYTPGGEILRKRYARPDFAPQPAPDVETVAAAIRSALEESVEFHLRSDVPVGAFLSSGIDSTAIVALARKHKPDILTFTVGYDVEGYSEIDVAQESARWLDVTTIPTFVTAEDMMEALPRIVWHLDDPVADAALVPLYFVAQKAAEHVTVVLSGEGADELFAGYPIYREAMSLESVSRLPNLFQKALRVLSSVIPEGVKGKSFIERGTTPINERYFGHIRMFSDAERRKLLRNYDPSVQPTELTAEHYALARQWDPITQMQYIDFFTWLRGDILVKADRMSMAHSLELRVPFLDSGVFGIARSIPPEFKVTRQGIFKYALRRAMEGIVPPQIVNRPKLGFPVPTRVWLRDVMYDWAREILTNSEAGDLIDLGYARSLLEAHRRGERDYSAKVWTVLVFCLWHAIFVTKTLDPAPAPTRSRLG